MRPVPGLAVALSALFVLAGCGSTQVDATPVSAEASSRPSGEAKAPEPLPNARPAGTWTAIDTRCGVVSAEVDGTLWIADPPLGDGGPPAGWDDDRTWGHLIPGAKGRAMFRGEGGQVALFRKAAPKEDDPAADCG